MGLLVILVLSALLLGGVTHWCASQGLFAPGSMGFGFLIAFVVYAVFWLLPTAAITGAWFVLGR
jgi:multisubunit Na+/H+ antiporter MnhE subunit